MSGKNPSIDRLSELAQQWFLSEPLLFGVWTTHRIVPHPHIATIRVGRGLIEVNLEFIDSLDLRTLREVMKFEAVRIVLKHPYDRKQPNNEWAYEASNLAIQECMQTALSMPSAEERFGTDEHDNKFFEYYYQVLSAENGWQGGDEGDSDCEAVCGPKSKQSDEAQCNETGEACDSDEDGQCESASSGLGECESESNGDGAKNGKGSSSGKGETGKGSASGRTGEQDQGNESSSQTLPSPPEAAKSELDSYCDKELVASENTANWHEDTLFRERINEVITEVEASQSWGSMPGAARENILATLVPKLDYRKVLRAFRANILSSQRRLTRMKPSRRYGFDYMGSRRDFCTKLLFAVDVSGSVGTADVQAAFSIVNRLFKYGIESIDVIWFDTDIRNEEPVELKKALREFEVDGRGGTDFQPLMHYLDEHRQYDGLIVFTDGIAPVPTPPQSNRRTRVVWLFNHEENWKLHHTGLEEAKMQTAFVLADG